MKKNSASIYGCGKSELPKPENGRITRNGNRLYYHIFEPAIGAVPLYGVRPAEIKKVRLLADGSELKVADNWIVNNYQDVAFVELSDTPELPDEVDTVVEVEYSV